MPKTLLRRGASRNISHSVSSRRQAHRLSRALSDLRESDLNTLQQAGKVCKIDIPNSDNIYLYRAGLNERIIFSPQNGEHIIYDIVDVSPAATIKSLTIEEKKQRK